MGGSVSTNIRQKVNAVRRIDSYYHVLECKHYQDELKIIRDTFSNFHAINFGENATFILYAPPEYPTQWAAKYLGSCLKLPVLHPDEYITERNGATKKLEDIENVSSQYLKRLPSDIEDGATRQALRRRLYNEDCAKGCILYEYPDTVSELRYLKDNMLSHMKVFLLFLEMDNEVH